MSEWDDESVDWWEDDESEDDESGEDDETAPWEPEWGDMDDQDGQQNEWPHTDEQAEQLHGEWEEELEIQIEQDEKPPEPEGEEQLERKKLKREIDAEALARLEDAARTPADFKRVIDWWNNLDKNRERRERYHEVLRDGYDVPLDYGAAQNGHYFPANLNRALTKQIRKGYFLDAIFYCPFELHELVTDTYISNILRDLKEEQKELLFYYALRQYSTTRIAAVRGQSDRNIRKVRTTMLKQIHKKLLAALREKVKRHMSLTFEEKAFLAEYDKTALDESKDG